MDYEEKFTAIMRMAEQEIFHVSYGPVPKGKNLKKTFNHGWLYYCRQKMADSPNWPPGQIGDARHASQFARRILLNTS
jgi:hypothetical protein